MILAEKIMNLRKKNGWSQEELATQMNVSRQSVSKWESAASIPDLDKILRLSQIFGVSTDYLLRDDLEEDPQSPPMDSGEDESLRNISLEEANIYMDQVERLAPRIALAVSMFILSPVILMAICGMAEYGRSPLTEDMAGGIGVGLLLLIVAAGLAVVIPPCMELSRYEFLEKEVFYTEYGVIGVVQKRREDYEPTYRIHLVAGIVLCIVGVIPLMILAGLNAPDYLYVYGVCLILISVAVGVNRMVHVGMIHESYTRLLQEGDYLPEKKLEGRKNEHITTIYWCTVTAIYLGWSFITDDWNRTWIIWPVAGVLFAAVLGVVATIRNRN